MRLVVGGSKPISSGGLSITVSPGWSCQYAPPSLGRDTSRDGSTPAYSYAPVSTATGADTYPCLCYSLCRSALGTYAFDALGGSASPSQKIYPRIRLLLGVYTTKYAV